MEASTKSWPFAPIATVAVAALSTLVPADAEARSKAAEWLIQQQTEKACDGAPASIMPAAIYEGDLTGDGRDDLIIHHAGIQCGDQGLSLFCGASNCSLLIYVRRGDLLVLEDELLALDFTVKDTSGPVTINVVSGAGTDTLTWDGSGFR
ncbi:hypothetical protein [Amorphus sp. MBR-141]